MGIEKHSVRGRVGSTAVVSDITSLHVQYNIIATVHTYYTSTVVQAVYTRGRLPTCLAVTDSGVLKTISTAFLGIQPQHARRVIDARAVSICSRSYVRSRVRMSSLLRSGRAESTTTHNIVL